MLLRVVLGSLCIASAVQAQPAEQVDAPAVRDTAGEAADRDGTAKPLTLEGSLFAGRSDVTTLYGGRATLRAKRLLAGVGFLDASASAIDSVTPREMHVDNSIRTRRVRSNHRFFDAYIEDTVRLIRSLDISAGFVIERWEYLGSTDTITYGTGTEMEVEIPPVTDFLLSPSLGATYRVNDGLALRVKSQRNLRAPTQGELYDATALGSQQVSANNLLRPETAWTTSVGPEVTAGPVTASTQVFRTNLDNAIGIAAASDGSDMLQRQNVGDAHVTGITSAASYRPAKPWLATVRYTFAAAKAANEVQFLRARHHATALLTYSDARVGVTGAAHVVDGVPLVDALASRTLFGRTTGYVAVDNLLDRRAVVVPAPRTFSLGLRLATR